MSLQNRSIAVLVYPNYQELEFWYPVLRAREDGARVTVVAPSDVECESFLGYPVVGDTAAAEVNVETLDALVLPGAVPGLPNASEGQLQLIKSAHAAGRPVYAVGTGTALAASVIGDLDDTRRAADADGLPDLVARLRAELDR